MRELLAKYSGAIQFLLLHSKTVITWGIILPNNSIGKCKYIFGVFLEYGKIGTLAIKGSKSCGPVQMALQATRVFIFTRRISHVPCRFDISVPCIGFCRLK